MLMRAFSFCAGKIIFKIDLLGLQRITFSGERADRGASALGYRPIPGKLAAFFDGILTASAFFRFFCGDSHSTPPVRAFASSCTGSCWPHH